VIMADASEARNRHGPTRSPAASRACRHWRSTKAGQRFLGDPKLLLALRHDPARRDRVDADAVRTERAGQRLGQPMTPALAAA
jgi:hypothetical protein